MGSKESIAIFVDYENIRMGLKHKYGIDADPQKIATALKSSIAEYGDMLTGYVYGDWSLQHTLDGKKVHTARAFEEQGFTAIMVSTKPSGQDRTDSRLNVDCFECLVTQKNITAFMIVGGDGDYSYLSRRIRGNGKRVMVCAFGHSVNSELLAIANPFLAIESLLNVEASISPEIPLGGYNWEPLIKQLDTAEKTLPFVGFKHFRDKWLVPTIGSIETIEQRHRLLNDAQQEKLIEIYQQSNPGAQYPTAAVKLNRSHPQVIKVLSPDDSGLS